MRNIRKPPLLSEPNTYFNSVVILVLPSDYSIKYFKLINLILLLTIDLMFYFISLYRSNKELVENLSS